LNSLLGEYKRGSRVEGRENRELAAVRQAVKRMKEVL
jgi:hypothetical protein